MENKMVMSLGMRIGIGGGGDVCAPVGDELIYNYTFDCGINGWGFDSNYPATISDNGDGSVHLVADSNFGSLVPARFSGDDTTLPEDDYVIECEVLSITGTGKMSLRRENNQWFNSPDITTTGIHTFSYTGNIKEIHVGANGDENFEADYGYISLKRVVTTVTHTGIPVEFEGNSVEFNG